MSSLETPAEKRVCQVIAVRQEHLEEYKAIHKNVWTTVLDGLRRSHIVDYSIHFLPSPPFAIINNSSTEDIGGLLIATFKYIGQDFEGDMKRVAEDEETGRWWKITDGTQRSLVETARSSEEGEWWYKCEEVFRFDE